VQEHREPTGALLDPGLIPLVMMLRFQGLGVDPEQILISSGGADRSSEMLRCAKAFA